MNIGVDSGKSYVRYGYLNFASCGILIFRAMGLEEEVQPRCRTKCWAR